MRKLRVIKATPDSRIITSITSHSVRSNRYKLSFFLKLQVILSNFHSIFCCAHKET